MWWVCLERAGWFWRQIFIAVLRLSWVPRMPFDISDWLFPPPFRSNLMTQTTYMEMFCSFRDLPKICRCYEITLGSLVGGLVKEVKSKVWSNRTKRSIETVTAAALQRSSKGLWKLKDFFFKFVYLFSNLPDPINGWFYSLCQCTKTIKYGEKTT